MNKILAAAVLAVSVASAADVKTANDLRDAVAPIAPAARPLPPGSPLPSVVSPRRTVTDIFHGIAVSEDYRWLENYESPEVKAWNEAQNRRSRAYLDSVAGRAALRDRIRDYYQKVSPSYFSLEVRGGAYFAMKFQPPKDQPMLVVLKSPEDPASERVLIDPNVKNHKGTLAIDWFVPSLDGSKVAVAMSEKGSEDATLYFFDAATGAELADRVPRVNYPTAGGSAAWNSDGTGVFYTRYPQNGERPKEDENFYQQIYFHKLGTPASQDAYVLGKDFPRIAEVKLETRGDGKHLLASVANGDGGEFAHYLRAPNGAWTQLTCFEDKIIHAALGLDDAVYLLSRKDAPRGKVLRMPFNATSLADAATIIPEGEFVIEPQGLTPTSRKLFVTYLAGGPNLASIYELDGKTAGSIPLPPVASLQELSPIGGDEVLARIQTYLAPAAWYRYGGKGEFRRTELYVKSPVDFADAEVVREFAVSKDGTKVPLNIIRRKGVKLDGTNPTLLYGYGGYGISMTPSFLGILGRLWLDRGGVYVVANLRGGGEFGEAWHRSGNLLNKQRVFDDFIAGALHLIARGYTSPKRLVIEGGSNGGLLMGAALVQRPDLFRAVISHVGIYDMLRVELSPNGAFNVTEFGTVKDPEQFKALYAYSPYHHVVDGTAYPAVLFMTGDHDGRVDPMNSRKMTARLQAATSSARPILLRTNSNSGHGMGTALSERIEQGADGLAFFFNELGLAR